MFYLPLSINQNHLLEEIKEHPFTVTFRTNHIELVKRIAYQLWLDEGKPNNKELAHYYEAEQMLDTFFFSHFQIIKNS